MSDLQWHVFYRTVGMQESKQQGFRRADFLADSAEDAIERLIETRRNVLHARAYPGASAFTVSVDWTPKIVVKHKPHAALTPGDTEQCDSLSPETQTRCQLSMGHGSAHHGDREPGLSSSWAAAAAAHTPPGDTNGNV